MKKMINNSSKNKKMNSKLNQMKNIMINDNYTLPNDTNEIK